MMKAVDIIYLLAIFDKNMLPYASFSFVFKALYFFTEK